MIVPTLLANLLTTIVGVGIGYLLSQRLERQLEVRRTRETARRYRGLLCRELERCVEMVGLARRRMAAGLEAGPLVPVIASMDVAFRGAMAAGVLEDLDSGQIDAVLEAYLDLRSLPAADPDRLARLFEDAEAHCRTALAGLGWEASAAS